MDDREYLTDYYGQIYIAGMEQRRVKLMETGEWYETTEGGTTAHFFMCANPKANTAVSMCGTQVAKIEDLHAHGEGKVCLTCSLYEQSGKGLTYQAKLEKRRQHAARVQEIVEAREAKRVREKERRSKGRKSITRSE